MNASELKKRREKMGLSQGELAKALGVHIITINRWENEAREIPPYLDLALKTIEREARRKK